MANELQPKTIKKAVTLTIDIFIEDGKVSAKSTLKHRVKRDVAIDMIAQYVERLTKKADA